MRNKAHLCEQLVHNTVMHTCPVSGGTSSLRSKIENVRISLICSHCTDINPLPSEEYQLITPIP